MVNTTLNLHVGAAKYTYIPKNIKEFSCLSLLYFVDIICLQFIYKPLLKCYPDRRNKWLLKTQQTSSLTESP